MKKNLKLILKTFIFLILLLICFFAVVIIVERKESYIKNKNFFEQAKEDHIDVLFLGSSHVINGINPVTLYRDYGITSYNLGGHGSVLQATYWELIEALDYCKPDYVVVDSYMLEKNYQYLDVMEENAGEDDINTSVEQLHLNMDAFPLNKLKVAAIKDLIQDKDIQNQFLFDFIVYHDRWEELSKEDFGVLNNKIDLNTLMGGEIRYEVENELEEYVQAGEDEILAEHTVGCEYLMKIIDECQRDGIGILVTTLPFKETYDDQLAAHTAASISADYGVTYFNMNDLGVIDEEADLNDPGHLNVTGSEKTTDYIGQWLRNNTDLADHRGDSEYSDWDSAVESYNSELYEQMKGQSNLESFLNVLNHDSVSCVVYVNMGSDAFIDEGVKHLIKNLSGTERIDEAAAAGGSYILIRDIASGNRYEAVNGESLESVSTSMGEVTYIPIEEKFRLFYRDEDPDTNYLYSDEHLYSDIQIITYDNENGEILSQVYFTSEGETYISE
ncbi:MAG: hypothetical protein K6B41_07315 [Butyrivibrio sp.]|nr:hypothetical protein [Butyrivibrio sp.]